MNSTVQPRLVRLQRVSLVAAALTAAIAVALGFFSPGSLAAAYRFAAFGCLCPAFGALMFLLIYRMTGGQWARALTPFLSAATALLPWIWVLTLPLLFFPHHGTAQLAATAPPSDFYNSLPMRFARALGYAVFFFLVTAAVKRALAAERSGRFDAWRWIGPVGLISLVFLLHLLAQDWLADLEPGWHSTAFPLAWMTGQAVAGLSFAVLLAIISGASPDEIGPAHRLVGIDWGNLLLTAVIFWTYVCFAQFLIIWAGNLPREISWYLRRSHGGWLAIIAALAVFHFALPFLFLLSRRFKRFPAGLGGIAALLLVCQLVYTAWIILPAFAPVTAASLGLAVAFGVAAAALLFNRTIALARASAEMSR